MVFDRRLEIKIHTYAHSCKVNHFQFLSNFHMMDASKTSIMLRGNNHSRGTLFPGVGATGGGGGGKSIRIKQQQRYKMDKKTTRSCYTPSRGPSQRVFVLLEQRVIES